MVSPLICSFPLHGGELAAVVWTSPTALLGGSGSLDLRTRVALSGWLRAFLGLSHPSPLRLLFHSRPGGRKSRCSALAFEENTVLACGLGEVHLVLGFLRL